MNVLQSSELKFEAKPKKTKKNNDEPKDGEDLGVDKDADFGQDDFLAKADNFDNMINDEDGEEESYVEGEEDGFMGSEDKPTQKRTSGKKKDRERARSERKERRKNKKGKKESRKSRRR